MIYQSKNWYKMKKIIVCVIYMQGLYVWPEETDVLARKVWEDCMKKRFPDIMRRAREASLKLAKAANVNASLEGDLNLLKDYRPNWIKKEYWEKMINEVWTTSKWKRLSQSGKNNINKLEDGYVSKHTGGSISIRQHKKRMVRCLHLTLVSTQTVEFLFCFLMYY